jgi:hypothetical protein
MTLAAIGNGQSRYTRRNFMKGKKLINNGFEVRTDLIHAGVKVQ